MSPASPSPAASAATPLRGDALSYESALPLHWQPLERLPDALTLDRHNDENLRVLAAVALLDEQRGNGPGTGDDVSGVEAEIARLNQKMNLLVELVSFLVGQQAPPPPAQAVRLSWQGVGWHGEAALGDGLVSLRLHRSVPQPFVWPARIVIAEAGELYARFAPFSEPCQAALERHVFLHHRRAIAGTRRPTP